MRGRTKKQIETRLDDSLDKAKAVGNGVVKAGRTVQGSGRRGVDDLKRRRDRMTPDGRRAAARERD